MAETCFYKGCNSRREGKSTFWFPVLHRLRCILWLKNSGNTYTGDIKDLSDQFLCPRHFRPEDIIQYGYKNESITLALSAIPFPYVPNEGTGMDVTQIQNRVSSPKQMNKFQPLYNANIKRVQPKKLPKLQGVSKQLKVFTTRLDDMKIFRKEVDCMTFSELIPHIIAESKPFYIEKPNKKKVKEKPIKDRKTRLSVLLDKLKHRREQFSLLRKKLGEVTRWTRNQRSITIPVKIERIEADSDEITCTENILVHPDIHPQIKEETSEYYSTLSSSVATVNMLKSESVIQTPKPKNTPTLIEKFYLNLKNMDNRVTFENKLQKSAIISDLVLIMKVKLDLHVYHISENKSILSYKKYVLDNTNLEITLPKYGDLVKSVDLCCWFDMELFLIQCGSRFFNHVQFARETHKCLPNACSCCCNIQPRIKVEKCEVSKEVEEKSYLENHKASENASNNFIEKALQFSRNFTLETPHDKDYKSTDNSLVDDKFLVLEFVNNTNYEYYEKKLNNVVISASRKRFTSENKRKDDKVANVENYIHYNFCPLKQKLNNVTKVTPKFIKVNHNSSECNKCKTTLPKITKTALEQLSLSLLKDPSELRMKLRMTVNNKTLTFVDNSLATLIRKAEFKNLLAAIPIKSSTFQPLISQQGHVSYHPIAPSPVRYPKSIVPQLVPIVDNRKRRARKQPKREVNVKVNFTGDRLGYKIPAAFTKVKKINKTNPNVMFTYGLAMNKCVDLSKNCFISSAGTSRTIVPVETTSKEMTVFNLPPLKLKTKPISINQNQNIVLLKQPQTAEYVGTQSEPAMPSGSQQSPNSLPLVCQ